MIGLNLIVFWCTERTCEDSQSERGYLCARDMATLVYSPQCDTIGMSIQLFRDRTWYVFCILNNVRSNFLPPNDEGADYCHTWPASISHRWRCTMRVHVEHIFHARYIYILIGYVFFLCVFVYFSFIYNVCDRHENCELRQRENRELFIHKFFVTNIINVCM